MLNTPPRPPMSRALLPPRFRLLALAPLLGTALGAAACYQDPNQQLQEQQNLNDLADALNDLTSRMSEFTFTIDSLRAVVARQDTIIGRLANATGVPVR